MGYLTRAGELFTKGMREVENFEEKNAGMAFNLKSWLARV